MVTANSVQQMFKINTQWIGDDGGDSNSDDDDDDDGDGDGDAGAGDHDDNDTVIIAIEKLH